MNLSHFYNVLESIRIASSEYGAKTTNQYKNINGENLLAKLRCPTLGDKDGAHFLRTTLKAKDSRCLPRCNANTESLASLLIIDCDSRIDHNGEILEGAPDPVEISHLLKKHNIGFVLYGSYSHYAGKRNRYRIILITQNPYTKMQLAPTLENIISFINANLSNELLVNSNENNAWAQPWYFPRKPAISSINELYLEYIEGKLIEIVNPLIIPSTVAKEKSNLFPSNNIKTSTSFNDFGEISPIRAFNEQYPLSKLLPHFGYKKVYEMEDSEKWISSNSTSGEAGITHWPNQNKFYSHHNDEFHDGKSHDSFDLFRIKEGLDYRSAVTQAAKITKAPDGLSVDEHNKSLARNCRNSTK